MVTQLERHAIARDADVDAAWDAIVCDVRQWAGAREVALRDAVLLVPFAQLLAPARRAWARGGGWLPRIETTQTLAAALGPPPRRSAGQPTLDVARDRLAAAALLQTQSWLREWRRHDARRFEHAVGSVVELAQAFVRASAAQPPARREAWWDVARARLAQAPAVARAEGALARIALEWAATSTPPSTDALHALAPSAWIVVQAGGPDALAQSLVEQASAHRACLVVDADLPLDAPFAQVGVATRVATALSDDAEDEAQRAAAHVIATLHEGRVPVALIAQDRSLLRRVHALLARRGVPVVDETGWRLSTTRAAARVMSLLRAMRAEAPADDVLDALKTAARAGADALERALRRARCTTSRGIETLALQSDAAATWDAVAAQRAVFARAPRRPLAAWLEALDAALRALGHRAALEDDLAGRQVLAVLGLDGVAAPAAGDEAPLGFAEFVDWIDAVLEHASFVPETAPGAAVVITPLARAMLRPFAAVVLAGADERRLGAGGAALPLVGDADAAALGLPDAQRRRERELLAFAQLLRAPSLVLLRRRHDDSEPLGASVLWQRLVLTRRRRGLAVDDAPDARVRLDVAAAAIARPAPSAAALLPPRLSASAVEALRACPYRFHALDLLRLREVDELDDAVEKRHYGEWLHAVLHRFHATRERPQPADVEQQRLRELGSALRDESGLDAAAFVPYDATFERFVPRYVGWLHARDRDGARWREGELALEAAPPALGGMRLVGRIDRIDAVATPKGRALQLIDYKTGSATRLRQLVRQRGEDTQLAFYAALVADTRREEGGAAALQAAYLPLDDADGLALLPHDDVDATARALIDGLAHDLERLRAGTGLPALGEGALCEHCAVRGLCRRDDWAAA